MHFVVARLENPESLTASREGGLSWQRPPLTSPHQSQKLKGSMRPSQHTRNPQVADPSLRARVPGMSEANQHEFTSAFFLL